MLPFRSTLSALIALAAAAAVSAAPALKVDNTTYSGGKAAEGSVLKAQFKLTNTGDAPLKIENVRPGCGCTVVAYDTVIQPGKSGYIRPAVNLKNFRPGLMSRYVDVTSNAENTPSVRLIIEATVVAPVEVSENYLDFGTASKLTVLLTSAKADLKVSDIIFKPQQGGQNIPDWASNSPLKVKYAFAAADAKRDDGLKTYKLDINSPASGGKEAIVGTFEITTNHPDRKDIAIDGQVR
jgi:hypothetical protein